MQDKDLKKILIVEDDDSFRQLISDALSDDFKVFQSSGGRSAIEILSLQDFDLVLSDIQMPGFSGLELLEWSSKNNPVAFVLMTGYANLQDQQRAKDLGVKAFITKPFEVSQIKAILKQALNMTTEKKSPKKVNNEFCRVSISELITKSILEFDLYIKLSETNFIKVANKDHEFPAKQINQYRLKGIKYLYILKEDFKKLVHFTLGLAKVVTSKKEVSPNKKLAFMNYVGNVVMEKVFVEGLDPDNIESVSTFVELTVGSMTDSVEIFDLMESLKNASDQIFTHSIATAMYSVMIAKELKFESSVTSFKLCMAALFHDVGKKEVDKLILDKPRHLLNSQERKEVESHVVRGQDILNSIKNIHSDVVRLVGEHHEDMEGTGYPHRKHRKDQHPLSRILQCSNIFLENFNAFESKDAKTINVKNVLDQIQSIYGSRIDGQCLIALRSLFKSAPELAV